MDFFVQVLPWWPFRLWLIISSYLRQRLGCQALVGLTRRRSNWIWWNMYTTHQSPLVRRGDDEGGLEVTYNWWPAIRCIEVCWIHEFLLTRQSGTPVSVEGNYLPEALQTASCSWAFLELNTLSFRIWFAPAIHQPQYPISNLLIVYTPVDLYMSMCWRE